MLNGKCFKNAAKQCCLHSTRWYKTKCVLSGFRCFINKNYFHVSSECNSKMCDVKMNRKNKNIIIAEKRIKSCNLAAYLFLISKGQCVVGLLIVLNSAFLLCRKVRFELLMSGQSGRVYQEKMM